LVHVVHLAISDLDPELVSGDLELNCWRLDLNAGAVHLLAVLEETRTSLLRLVGYCEQIPG
jgi:hypothetical protein